MLSITEFNFITKEIKCLITSAFKSSFLPLNQKVKLLKRVNQELKEKGLEVHRDYV